VHAANASLIELRYAAKSRSSSELKLLFLFNKEAAALFYLFIFSILVSESNNTLVSRANRDWLPNLETDVS